jgi:hypothetical protein
MTAERFKGRLKRLEQKRRMLSEESVCIFEVTCGDEVIRAVMDTSNPAPGFNRRRRPAYRKPNSGEV